MSNIRGSDGSEIHLGEILEASDPGRGRVMSKNIRRYHLVDDLPKSFPEFLPLYRLRKWNMAMECKEITILALILAACHLIDGGYQSHWE